MRDCSAATAALLANPPVGLKSADLFTFTLLNGTVYCWTSYDVDLTVNGSVYSSKRPWLERSRWDVANTMQVPTLEVLLRALDFSFAGGIDIKGQLTNGLFDGATMTLDRIWFAAGTTVINDSVQYVAGRVIVTTTGSGSLDFTNDTRLKGFNTVNIEMIAGGGDGSATPSNGNGSRGGGGGQYAKLANFSPAGGVFNFQIGVRGGTVGTSAAPGTADSWWSNSASVLYAQGGTTATAGPQAMVPGGNAAAVGSSTVANGGQGGGCGLASQGSGGGGGAGGPNGAGGNGGYLPGSTLGGTGGAGDGGNAPGGAATTGNGGNGGTESAWGAGYGPGGGGAGGAGGAPFNGILTNGGNGGLYGAGGGGAGAGSSSGTNPGVGTSGILVVTNVGVHAGVRLFGGTVGPIEITGNQATINVKGKTNLLNQYAPRNLYQLGCQHAFCDAGCTLARATYTTSYTVGSSPTSTFIPWSGTPPTNPGRYRYGTVTFTSGACSGQQRTVRAADSTGLTLIHPTTGTPAAGDAFTAFEGCDKALNSGSGQDCTARSNTQNWRAFPYVPPADSAA